MRWLPREGRPTSFPFINKFDPNEPRDERGRWTDGGVSGAAMFASSNLANMNFAEASTALTTDRQSEMKAATADVNRMLGLTSSEHDALGAWKDGAENTVVSHIGATSWDRLEVAGAMTGALANQKAVLVFQAGAGDRSHFLATFTATGSMAEIHDALLARGLAFHTLEPTTSGGARVYVYGTDAATRQSVNDAGKFYGSKTSIGYGYGKFVGSSLESGSDAAIRADAQGVYDHTIRSFAAGQSGRQNVGLEWARLRDRWSALRKVFSKAALDVMNGWARR